MKRLYKIFAMTFCLCMVAFTSKTMAQTVGSQFNTDYGDFTILYEVMSANEVAVHSVGISSAMPIVLSIPETVSNYTVRQYWAPLDGGTGGEKVSGLVIPNTVDSIFGRYWNTESVCTLTLGTGVKYIDSEVFRGTRFSSITSNAVIPPTIYDGVHTHAFWDWEENMTWTPSCVVNVPCASLYQNSLWGTIFTNFNQTATCPAT
jgi:hypothetical protein